MSIESEILRIQHNVANTYAAVAGKGGAVPTQPTSANLAAAVESIQTGITQEELEAALATKQPKLTGQTGQVVGFGADGAAVAVQRWSNPNLLDNWYFADAVNQRGQTEYTSDGYAIDRWGLGRAEGTSGARAAVSSDGIKILPGNYIRQMQEDPRFEDVELTFSALINDDLFSFTFVWKNSTAYLASPVNRGWILAYSGAFKYVHLYNHSGEADDVVKAAKLELGPIQTLAHQDADGNWVLNDPPPNKALELAKCQRYQLCIGVPGLPAYLGIGMATSSEEVMLMIPVPVTMRAIPTSLELPQGSVVLRNGTTYFTATNIQANMYSQNIIGALLTVSGVTTGSPYEVYVNEGRLILDANL